MTYRVVKAFADKHDNGYIYQVGDAYPRMGFSVSEQRLEELSSDRNQCGVALIVNEDIEEGLSDTKEDTRKTEAGVDPSDGPTAKERPRRRKEK